eukprot:TRINITY_DN16073_c0_g1_i1.p2 TRINITY_DN16073_c0_g1~~TRINITY_DN16073_c0_g1_i1.p2  ORF type:complete len:135 (-),score=33.73 TRINITY_DN16073_c0_g1_i1:160-564(-)
MPVYAAAQAGAHRQLASKRARTENSEQLGEADKAFVSQVFTQFDKDNTGALSAKELKSVMTLLNDNIEPTDEEVAFVLRKADKDESKTISRDEFDAAIAVWYLQIEVNRQREEREKGQAAMDEHAAQSKCCLVS